MNFEHLDRLGSFDFEKKFKRFEKRMARIHEQMYDLDEDFHDLLQIGSDNTLSSHRSRNTNKYDSGSKLRRNQKKSNTKFFTESYKETYKNYNGAESRVIKEEKN